MTISYDSQTKYLVVVRTASADVSIPNFDRISHTRIPDKNGILDIDIFVDKSTVEIFVSNGKTLTMLTYSAKYIDEANLISPKRHHRSFSLSAWPMKSNLVKQNPDTLSRGRILTYDSLICCCFSISINLYA